jgi:deoxyribodipyrimidine photo-lyase
VFVSVTVVLFTRDLRLHDNPTLAAAMRAAEQVVPLFVLDQAILGHGFNRPNRASFLVDCLRDLDAALRQRGSVLLVRRGDVIEEVAKVAVEAGAGAVHVSGDVSAYARSRERRLRNRLAEHLIELLVHDDTLFAVPPGEVTPQGGDHMAVFTPYFRRWQHLHPRALAVTPRRLRTPRLANGGIPAAGQLCDGPPSPDLPPGGERAGRRQLSAWLRRGLSAYADGHDALADDATSRLSPYLHFGCLSPVELIHRASQTDGPGPDAFVRQLAWRDFHAQVLAARPDAARADYRSRGDRWHHDDDELAAWRTGRTGYPVVDAAMRQLAREGWMHNRARLIAAYFLCKTLYLDWRLGAAHFIDLLVDGDVANNTMNWQWVAGTGTDTRFNRSYNVVRQGKRHDPRGEYVRRYVEELAAVEDAYIHQPWLLPREQREALGYPAPIVDEDVARDRMRRARGQRGGGASPDSRSSR